MAEETSLGEYIESEAGGGRAVAGRSREVLTVAEARHAALYYHDLGWAVTAGPGLDEVGNCACHDGAKCHNPGKHAYAGWGEPDRRTMTREQIERYWSVDNARWETTPVDHVFIVPYLSGLVVADVDRMENWLDLPEELRPETLWVESGSGRGGHFFYRYSWDESGPAPSLPGKLPGRAGELKFRGIIVAPPCVHKKGGRYRWANSAASWFTRGVSEIPYAPDGLLKKAERSYGTPYSDDEEWATLRAAIDANDGKLTFWTAQLFAADKGSLMSVARVAHGKPVAMFAAAAGIARWVTAGVITEDEVVEILLDACAENGALDKYGEKELKRQILNGIETGKAALGEDK